jgi:4-aminobutyrate aminotransferase-like enzyme
MLNFLFLRHRRATNLLAVPKPRHQGEYARVGTAGTLSSSRASGWPSWTAAAIVAGASQSPIGNGYPLGVVVTTQAIRNRFGEATDFFSTFGGNPVGCAAGIAVLDVIEREGLMENARLTGEYLRGRIRQLMKRHAWIGDVRGEGLLVGVEVVLDRDTLTPAVAETRRVLDHLRDNFVLVGSEGTHGNVLKIRPPLAFRREHADIVTEALDKALAAL